jgi:hypothetical protein
MLLAGVRWEWGYGGEEDGGVVVGNWEDWENSRSLSFPLDEPREDIVPNEGCCGDVGPRGKNEI